jgi:CRP-like cAMP-binding protein
MNPTDREAILYAFAIEPSHDQQTVERYLREYPDLSEELVDILSERRLREATGSESLDAVADPHLEEAWERFRHCKPQEVISAQAENPFAAFRGRAFAKLAQALDMPRSILAAMRDGLVQASSIPDRIVQRLAQETGSSNDSLRRYLAKPQPSFLGRAFKADEKPSYQGQVTFKELLGRTNMSPEQRMRLLEDCKDDGHDGGQSTKG